MSTSAESELLIGLVAPVGVDLDAIQSLLQSYLNQFGYKVETHRLSALINTIDGLTNEVTEDPPFDRVDSYMTAGNEARRLAGRGDILAAHAVYEIHGLRKKEAPLPRTAHLLRSLKHPDEVRLLRSVYGDGFFLLGIASSRTNMRNYLVNVKGMTAEQAEYLITWCKYIR